LTRPWPQTAAKNGDFRFKFRICRIYFLFEPGKLDSNLVRLYQMAFGSLEGMTGLNMGRGLDQTLDFTYFHLPKVSSKTNQFLTRRKQPWKSKNH
jgi:hypothetical protein